MNSENGMGPWSAIARRTASETSSLTGPSLRDNLPMESEEAVEPKPAATVVEARPDEVEIEAAWWATPAAVLDEHELGTTLMWPTFNTLKDLAQCRTVEEILELHLSQVPPPVRP